MKTIVVVLVLVFFFSSFVSAQPFTLKWESEPTDCQVSHRAPLAVDVNNDGIMEVFVSGDNASDSGLDNIVCLNGSDGSVIWRYSHWCITGHNPIEIYDLDNDGNYELIQPTPCAMTVLNAEDGSLYWQNTAIKCGEAHQVVLDTDGTGQPYIYTASGDKKYPYDAKLRKVNGSTGEILIEKSIFYPCHGGLSAADVDNDGDFEIFMTDRNDAIGKGPQAYDADTLELLWQRKDIFCSSHQPVIVDVNDDGILDVVVSHQSASNAGIFCLHGTNGTNIPDKFDYSIPGIESHEAFAVHDIDNDGDLEMAICANGPVDIFDLGNWEIEATLPHYGLPDKPAKPPYYANVMGDEDLEIIISSHVYDIHIYSNTYELLHTLNLPNGCKESGTQDIDGDGLNELMVMSGNNGIVKVYDTEALALDPLPRTNTQHFNERSTRTGVYLAPPGGEPPPCDDVELQIPIVTPASPFDNQSFTISCPANNVYNCITAYVDSSQCSFSQWTGNTAIFDCNPQSAGEHSAKCKSSTGSQNCCLDEKTQSFTIQQSGTLIISFIPPTPTDGTTITDNSTTIAVSVSGTTEASSFIDWNQSLVGYWSFNEGSGSIASDSSTYGNDGTLGGPQWTTGKRGDALDFEPNNFVEVADSHSIDVNEAITIEAWVQLDSISPSRGFLEKGNSGDTRNYQFGTGSAGQRLRFRWRDSDSLKDSINHGFSPGEWHHVAVTVDTVNDVLKFYSDGLQLGEDIPFTDDLPENDEPIKIGRSLDGYFNGAIDEVRVWDRVLSEQELTASYDTTLYSLSRAFTGLADGVYQYYARTSDDSGNTVQTETRTLTVDSTANAPPVLGNPIPTGGSTGQQLNFAWKIPISDLEDDLFDWFIRCSNGQSNSAANNSDGTKSLQLNGLSYSTSYSVSVSAVDEGSGSWTNQSFSFTTQGSGSGGGGGSGGGSGGGNGVVVPVPVNNTTSNQTIPVNDSLNQSKPVEIPACFDDGVCTPEEEQLGNCLDCAYVPQCVDDFVCSSEEAGLGVCGDCNASSVVIPTNFVPIFLWIRASAGVILLIAALILLAGVYLFWKKRHPKKPPAP